MTTRKSAVTIFLLTTLFVTTPSLVWANIEITEVLYNPVGSDTGREWFELRNAGDTAVTFGGGAKGWRVSDGSNHIFANSFTLLPGSFIIVTSNPATFAAQYGDTISTVKSAISLNNTGATISILDAGGKMVDTMSYTKNLGAYDDGASLHKSGGVFIAGAPDPGLLGEVTPLPAKPAASPKKTQVAAVAEVTVPTVSKSAPELPVAATSTLATSAAPEVRGNPGGALWGWILALGALIVLGVASVWYVQMPETSIAEDEFELE